MNSLRRIIAIVSVSAPMLLVGCQRPLPAVSHKLVVIANQHSVPLYPDEDTYLKVARMRQQGGVEGMIGEVGKKLEAREIDDQTAVKIVSSDDYGSVIEIIDGPMRGHTGFVAKQNID